MRNSGRGDQGKGHNTAARYNVQVLDRAVSILEVLSGQSSELTLAEVSERLKMHKSTVYRLLMVLERHRLVEKGRQNNRGYRLGIKFFELASNVLSRLDLRERARPYLQRLASETSETAHLCTLSDGEVVYLEKVEASRTFRVPSIVGRRYPAHCGAAGKALLAFLREKELNEIIRVIRMKGLKAYTRNTITTIGRLKRELRNILERGYSVDNEEFEEGLKCIGAPVKDYFGKVIGSISIAGPASRLTDDKVPTLARSVVVAANELSAELGYQEPTRGEPLAIVAGSRARE